MLAVIVVGPRRRRWPVIEVWYSEDEQLKGMVLTAQGVKEVAPYPTWKTVADALKARNRGVLHATFVQALTPDKLLKLLGREYTPPER